MSYTDILNDPNSIKKNTPWGDLSHLGTPRGYAELDPNAQATIDRSVALGAQSPQALSNSQLGDLRTSESLLSRPGSNDLRMGMGGNDAFNQAIQERSAKIYSADIDRLKSQNLANSYGTLSHTNDMAFHQGQTANSIQMGAYQKRFEYDQNRRAVRQQIINGVMGTGGKIIGTIFGGVAGGANAATQQEQPPPQSSGSDSWGTGKNTNSNSGNYPNTSWGGNTA